MHEARLCHKKKMSSEHGIDAIGKEVVARAVVEKILDGSTQKVPRSSNDPYHEDETEQEGGGNHIVGPHLVAYGNTEGTGEILG